MELISGYSRYLDRYFIVGVCYQQRYYSWDTSFTREWKI